MLLHLEIHRLLLFLFVMIAFGRTLCLRARTFVRFYLVRVVLHGLMRLYRSSVDSSLAGIFLFVLFPLLTLP